MNKRLTTFYWMTVPAVLLFFIFLTLPACRDFITRSPIGTDSAISTTLSGLRTILICFKTTMWAMLTGLLSNLRLWLPLRLIFSAC